MDGWTEEKTDHKPLTIDMEQQELVNMFTATYLNDNPSGLTVQTSKGNGIAPWVLETVDSFMFNDTGRKKQQYIDFKSDFL